MTATTIPTYSLLGPRATPPSEYEIVTSRLHPYVERGFEVEVPLAEWYARYQTASPLRCAHWDAFFDPRETTYTSYTRLQHRQESEVATILAAIEATPPSAGDPALCKLLSVLRFPLHGLHMIASYIGHMAPGGRITIAALLQSADELRRIERFAYRLALLRRSEPGFGDDGRQIWLTDPSWQPLRELIERLLVTYDWGEAFVALALCVKPALDHLVTVQWAARLAAEADTFAPVLDSLAADCRWHRAWAAALIRTIVDDTPASRDAIDTWLARWTEPAAAAVAAVAPLFVSDRDAALAAISDARTKLFADAGLGGSTP